MRTKARTETKPSSTPSSSFIPMRNRLLESKRSLDNSPGLTHQFMALTGKPLTSQPYEQQADRAANLVMLAPEKRAQRPTASGSSEEEAVHAKPVLAKIMPGVQRQAKPDEESDTVDLEIEALDLAPAAEKAAYELKRKHPNIKFTSGRRSLAGQARAMAKNIVKSGDRKWIEKTYSNTSSRRKLQKWVDDNTEATTVSGIAKGLEGILTTLTERQRSYISKHLSGEAFDVRPVRENAEQIIRDINALSGLDRFLTREGGLVRWHAQFKKFRGINGATDKHELEAESVAQKLTQSEVSDRLLHRITAGLRPPNIRPPILDSTFESRNGRPLDGFLRAFFEPRFGYDFREVRVHTDAKAAESARAMNALAYTVGKHVVFGKGQYRPGTKAGRHLLGHELAHVVQQNRLMPQAYVAYTHTSATADREAGPVAPALAGNADVRPLPRTSMAILQAQAKSSVFSGEMPNFNAQLECVKRLGGCPETRPGGFPSAEEISAYNAECRQETGYTGPDVTPTRAQCAGRGGKVCLTFDDGPGPGTEECLDALGDRIKATFFLIGSEMKKNPNSKRLIERMFKEGHQIGNHTFTHDVASRMEYEAEYGDLTVPANLTKFQEDYEKNEESFRTLLGKTSPVFRLARLPGQGRFITVDGWPWFGALIFVIGTEAMGMRHVGWNFEFCYKSGWSHLKARWQSQGMNDVEVEHDRLPKPNDIILFHDRHWAGKMEKLKAIFQKLTDAGFTFGKIDESGKCD